MMNGHQIDLISIFSTTKSGTLCLNGTKCSLQSQSIRLNSGQCWRQSGKTCHKGLSTWLCYNSVRGYMRAYEQMEVTLNTYSNRIGTINKRPFSGSKLT